MALVLQASRETILGRSRELPAEAIDALSERYRSFAMRTRFALILDADQPAADVAADACTAVRRWREEQAG
jgi:hypothetical protein